MNLLLYLPKPRLTSKRLAPSEVRCLQPSSSSWFEAGQKLLSSQQASENPLGNPKGSLSDAAGNFSGGGQRHICLWRQLVCGTLRWVDRELRMGLFLIKMNLIWFSLLDGAVEGSFLKAARRLTGNNCANWSEYSWVTWSLQCSDTFHTTHSLCFVRKKPFAAISICYGVQLIGNRLAGLFPGLSVEGFVQCLNKALELDIGVCLYSFIQHYHTKTVSLSLRPDKSTHVFLSRWYLIH